MYLPGFTDCWFWIWTIPKDTQGITILDCYDLTIPSHGRLTIDLKRSWYILSGVNVQSKISRCHMMQWQLWTCILSSWVLPPGSPSGLHKGAEDSWRYQGVLPGVTLADGQKCQISVDLNHTRRLISPIGLLMFFGVPTNHIDIDHLWPSLEFVSDILFGVLMSLNTPRSGAVEQLRTAGFIHWKLDIHRHRPRICWNLREKPLDAWSIWSCGRMTGQNSGIHPRSCSTVWYTMYVHYWAAMLSDTFSICQRVEKRTRSWLVLPWISSNGWMVPKVSWREPLTGAPVARPQSQFRWGWGFLARIKARSKSFSMVKLSIKALWGLGGFWTCRRRAALAIYT